ncbi:MAG: lysophospholipid acyltransferase family protein, partial [Gammaproteobacteria bacterium]|nr:lysophospholipid acyltransferase family protein [Gammaproteobacteria bacterium]
MFESNRQSTQRHKFTVAPHLPASLGPLRKPLSRLIDSALGLDRLNAVYDEIPYHLDPHTFIRCTLDAIGVDVAIDKDSLENIPADGPCIVVANHPHGALDGGTMIEILMRRRADLRVMANHLLQGFAELAPVFIGVDPFGGSAAAHLNFRAVRDAMTWLKKGGLLLIFPGGEVSSVNLRARTIIDPPWDAGIGWLVEKSGAPVVPAFISGRNSALFQIAGLLHSHFRTALLAREALNHRGTVIKVKCGRIIDAETLKLLGRDAIAPYLQTSTYLIKARDAYKKSWKLKRISEPVIPDVPIGPPIDENLLSREIAALSPDRRLLRNGKLEVWYAEADQIPWLLQEIGRLRELTFRQVGEGTGKSADLDLFDSYYIHLFVWDSESKAVIGGYRLGEGDRILARFGAKGLYVRSLFRLERQLEEELHAALEVGRSFVRPEHQRNYSSLMLLWKGIGAYVARHPRYRVLFGPVSISNDYHPVSQQIIVRFLQRNSMEPKRASLVKPRQPFRSNHGEAQLVDLNVSDLRIIASLLSTVEDVNVGIPVILRQYLKLNGRILGFNVDPEFNNAIDC